MNTFNYFSRFADSFYIHTNKKMSAIDYDLSSFLKSHSQSQFDNLNIVSLMKCPISGKSMVVNESRDRLIVPGESHYYPIIDSIPIVIKSEALQS